VTRWVSIEVQILTVQIDTDTFHATSLVIPRQVYVPIHDFSTTLAALHLLKIPWERLVVFLVGMMSHKPCGLQKALHARTIVARRQV